MSQAITMPALSDTMRNGRLVKWVKKSGDKINKGDVIAQVETDKAVMEVEAFQDGYLSGPLAAEGTEAAVGQTIGYIADNNLAEISSAAAAAVEAPGLNAGNGNAAATPAVERSAVSPVLAASMAALRPSPRPGPPPSTRRASAGPAASRCLSGIRPYLRSRRGRPIG